MLTEKKVPVGTLIQELCAISAVKMRKIPLFDKDVFQEVRSIDDLWKTLKNFWNIFDYDILITVIDLSECFEARVELDKFLNRIDMSALQHLEPILYYKVHKQELELPVLRVKVNIEKCEKNCLDNVRELISEVFMLRKYSLRFKGIKEGCIEIILWVSKAVMSYLLYFKLTKENVIDLVAYNIICFQLNGMVLFLPTLSTMKVCELLTYTRMHLPIAVQILTLFKICIIFCKKNNKKHSNYNYIAVNFQGELL